MQSLTCFLLLAVTLLTIASAQMTFSDGWGAKRSSSKQLRPAEEEIKEDLFDPSEACTTAYTQAITQLHQKIMTLYENFEQCKNRAEAIFKHKQRQQQNN